MKPWINTLAMSLVAFACSFSIATAGNTGKVQVNQSSIDDHKVCGNPCPGKGMPKYRVHTMLVSLNITDTPVGYEPPKGPAVPVTLTYNQREAYQPADFTFFNLGKKWNFNWLSYVQDNPQSPGSQVRVYLPGGGTRDYGGYNSSNNTFSPDQRTGAQLVRVTSTNYERRMPDGSQYIYSASDGQQSYPRRIFLSQIRDAAGNAVTLHYDDQNRLIRLTDAIGQETLFDYKNADPLKITHVTDPFGRTADIHYDTSGRLISITDAINMTSTFTYDSGTFISSMTTPY
ncbi:MAG: RHS repeat protein, partial [Gammaproteobacteria bacterium]|nr:RHS repeat protein [Gammaproteobacteria bacterium]